MKNKKKLWLIIVISILVVILLIIGLFVNSLRPVSKNSENITFIINSGDSKMDITSNLKEANLIKNKYSTLIYMVLSGNTNLQAGSYEINRNMSSQEIIKIICNGDIIKKTVSITFKEGITLKEYLKLISDNTNLVYEDIEKEINDKEFLQSLIDDYWFLTDDILNSDIYYALEGYLFPETYEFFQDTNLEQVIRKILNVTDKKLSEVKETIDKSNMSVHEILTKASIAEKEAMDYEDRRKVVQVINSRLAQNWSLGMDVTTYYGVGKDMKDVLSNVDLNDENPYNTRLSGFKGLPVGPICNPSLASIKATLDPADTNYMYFIADVSTGKVYFTNDSDEFDALKLIYG